jgi:hypothetical protein
MTVTTIPEERVKTSELEELGFKTAADNVKSRRELARKMRIAFEHFRVVTPDHVTRFNEELKQKTYKMENGAFTYTYQTMVFTPIEKYPEVPPTEALEKLKEAKALNCFDAFEVANIQSRTVVPDPILFGRIGGCDNRYFIAQWDDDVRIEDILKEDEG